MASAGLGQARRGPARLDFSRLGWLSSVPLELDLARLGSIRLGLAWLGSAPFGTGLPGLAALGLARCAGLEYRLWSFSVDAMSSAGGGRWSNKKVNYFPPHVARQVPSASPHIVG